MPASEVIVRPNLLRLFATLILSDLGIAAGLFLACGLSWVSAILLAVAVVSTVLLYVASALRGTPEVRVSDEGFVAQTAFHSRSYRWQDIEGEFVPLRVGLLKMVVFRLTPEHKTRAGKLGRPPAPGYDAAISGHYRLTMEELADLLNRRKRSQSGGSEPEGRP